MIKTLQNHNYYAQYNEDTNEITSKNRTDHFNEPAGYSESKRGLERAWQKAEKEHNEYTTFQGFTRIMLDNKIKFHTYCMMD